MHGRLFGTLCQEYVLFMETLLACFAEIEYDITGGSQKNIARSSGLPAEGGDDGVKTGE